jgi:DNA repair protein RadC
MHRSVHQQSRHPRELLLLGQPQALSDEALLSVLVGEAGAAGLGRLVAREPVTTALWRMHADELVALEGVGPAGAARLLACLEMSRRAAGPAEDERPTISTPEDVVALCGPQLRGRDREHFWTLALNTKNRLLRIIEVSVGSLNASIVHPRELFKDAVRFSAASVVVVHNHPSGDPTPSGADIQLTRRLVKAGDVLGVEVLDHVVIGDGGSHASLRDLGLM